MKGGGQMRRRKGSSFSGRHRLRGQVVRWALLAAVVVLVLVLAYGYGCAVQKLVYSARGTLIFLPSSLP